MNVVNSMKAVVVALALAISSGANAVVPTLNVGDQASFTGIIGGDPDTFEFILADGSGIQGGLYALSLTFTPPSSVSTIDASLQWNIDGGTFQSFTGTQALNLALAVGNHTLSFTGNDNVFYGGTIAAVPEPESYAMFLAGLGMMGFVARRRRNNG